MQRTSEKGAVWYRKTVDIVSATLVILFGILLIFAWTLEMCGLHPHIFKEGNPSKKDDLYELNWGVHIDANSTEVFYSESDHDARGEGWRYHVYAEESGTALVQAESKKREAISITHGCGADYGVDTFLSGLYQELEIPEEYHCSTDKNYWAQYQKQDGSTLVIIKDSENTLFIAEELL